MWTSKLPDFNLKLKTQHSYFVAGHTGSPSTLTPESQQQPVGGGSPDPERPGSAQQLCRDPRLHGCLGEGLSKEVFSLQAGGRDSLSLSVCLIELLS